MSRRSHGHDSADPAPLALAVIGCGAVVEGLYLAPLRTLESRGIARVAALVDPDPARTAALARHFPSARTFARPAEALAQTPDLTIVASPPGFHMEHSVAALAAGSHVLCEKPMAIRLDDAERMVTAARVAGRVLAVGMTRRLYPSLVEARALLARGALGEGLRFVYRQGQVYGWPVSSDSAFRRATAGGGVLVDLGSHVLDFLGALFGRAIVAGYADDGQTDGVEANCRIEVAYPRAAGVVQLSWNQPLVTGLHILGSAGELRLDPTRIDGLWWRPHGGAWEHVLSAATWPSDLRPHPREGTPRSHHDCIYYQLVRVLRAMVHGEPVPVGGDDALDVVRTIDECYRRATPLPLPWLAPGEQAQSDARHWKGRRWLAA
ncbi:MAG: Gfo/Idh/MocA family oxidoreductase [Chloroflexi bacterium]|nr:MAG: Gfo/Idh/MocA family oxidoreductase [Chloroflexota bacterium]